MTSAFTIDLIWWITAVELPALAGLFWLIWRARQDSEQAHQRLRRELEQGVVLAREQLGAFKLDVAKTYASIAYLKDVEERLTAHLLRIEAKLDIRPEDEKRR